MDTAPEGSAVIHRDTLYAKIAWRIMPFLFAGYMIALIDRFNIGFAKLQFQQDLGINDAAFGLAAGMFSLGYIVFEVPSNLLLHRVGVRLTLLRIMALWGSVTVAMMFASSTFHFYGLRFLLGLAEAGFFPGILLYLTYWFPEERRGRVTTLFAAALPVGGMIGGPISGLIMDAFNGVQGLRGWQWLFLLEGLPAIGMGVLAYYVLSDRPSEAAWLSPAEKAAVSDDVDRSVAISRKAELDFGAALRKPAVWLFALIYLGYYFALTSISTWWPTLLKLVGSGSISQTGLWSGLISGVAAIGMVLIGRSSDRMQERRWHVALCGFRRCCGISVFAAGFIQPVLFGRSDDGCNHRHFHGAWTFLDYSLRSALRTRCRRGYRSDKLNRQFGRLPCADHHWDDQGQDGQSLLWAELRGDPARIGDVASAFRRTKVVSIEADRSQACSSKHDVSEG